MSSVICRDDQIDAQNCLDDLGTAVRVLEDSASVSLDEQSQAAVYELLYNMKQARESLCGLLLRDSAVTTTSSVGL